MITLGTAAYVFNIRHFTTHSFTLEVFRGNRTLQISLGLLVVAHALLIYTPFRNAFRLDPTTLRQWAIIVPSAIAIFLLNELWKHLLLKLDAHLAARKDYSLAA